MTNEAIDKYIEDAKAQGLSNFKNRDLQVHVERFTEYLVKANYTKGFTWMGIPVIQYPTDIIALQEIIWKVKPDRIIECGIAFGGLTLFLAQMMYATERVGTVYAVDIDPRKENVKTVMNRLSTVSDIDFKKRSSVDEEAFDFEYDAGTPTLVILDSNHTGDHVKKELEMYAPLVTVGSYIVVLDTAIERFGYLDKNQDRPWGPGNNPATAVKEFLGSDLGKCFEVDRDIEDRFLITAAIGGWLRRVK